MNEAIYNLASIIGGLLFGMVTLYRERNRHRPERMQRQLATVQVPSFQLDMSLDMSASLAATVNQLVQGQRDMNRRILDMDDQIKQRDKQIDKLERDYAILEREKTHLEHRVDQLENELRRHGLDVPETKHD